MFVHVARASRSSTPASVSLRGGPCGWLRDPRTSSAPFLGPSVRCSTWNIEGLEPALSSRMGSAGGCGPFGPSLVSLSRVTLGLTARGTHTVRRPVRFGGPSGSAFHVEPLNSYARIARRVSAAVRLSREPNRDTGTRGTELSRCLGAVAYRDRDDSAGRKSVVAPLKDREMGGLSKQRHRLVQTKLPAGCRGRFRVRLEEKQLAARPK